MSEYNLSSEQLSDYAPQFKVGDRIILSGAVYTARDAAHKRLTQMLDHGELLPFEIDGASIYYAGPTPAPPEMAVGSCGPTTSGRMDTYTPRLLDLGLACMIGKGERSKEVIEAIVRNQAVYLCAIGGAGALACSHITKSEVIAFEDLGCESVKKLQFENFPLIVAIDAAGGNIFDHT